MLTVSLDGLSSSCILCAQCWQCLSIVCLHPVSCVPNVDIVSRLFIFILYLVYPMLTVSLKINNRETISTLGTQDTGSIVYLHPVSCVPNVDSVSRLFIFILYLVCPMLTLSLDCLSSSCILCTQCWYCLSIVYLHPVSCVPNVDSVSRLFIFILYLVCPMLTLSLDYLSSSCILCTQCWQCLSIVCFHTVSCAPNVDIVSPLFVFILYLVYPMLTVSLKIKCLSIVCLHPVSCVPNVDSVSEDKVSLDGLSSSCILCAQCWHNRETLSTLGTQDTVSIVYLHPVSCVPNVDIVSRLFIFILYLVYPMLTQSRDTVNIGHTRYRIDCLSSSCILCAQCWHCLSSVYLHPVSCVPNVDIVSRLFIFILYLVCPMLTVSLDCLSSSCILCTQCWHCLSIVYLHPVSCVPNVDSVSRLFIFILYLVCVMLTVSLECLSSSCILCPNVDSVSRCLSSSCILGAQCWQCLSIVCLHPVSCVPNVDIVSRLFIFILYLVYPMLTVSLKINNRETISTLGTQDTGSIVYLHPVSCVPNVDSVSRLFIFILYLVCPMLTLSLDCLSSSCILCTQCWYCLSIVYLHPVSCVPNVDSVSRLFIFILYLVCPMLTLSLDYLSSSCILCTQCWQCLSIVYLHPVSCVPNVDSVSEDKQSRDNVNIGYTRYRIDCLSSSCILCTQCWHCLSIVYLHPVSCVPNVDIVSRLFIFILYLVCLMLRVSLECLSSSCILCAQCWQCLSIVYLHPVSCVPNVDSVSPLFFFILYLVYPMLTQSRDTVNIGYTRYRIDCLSSSCILCAQCWHCLSSVYLHPVSCVPNVDIVSRLFIFILYLVYPMLTVSLDCLSSSCILCTQCWHNRETLSTLGTQDTGSIVYLHPVSCVPNVDIVSRLFIFILYLVCPMLTQSRDTVNIGHTRYRMKINTRQTMSTLGTQDTGSIVYLHPVSCVPNVDSVFRLLSSSCILCAQCWHCLSSVYLHPVSCVPNVDSVSRLFIVILYLVYPMLTLSLDCLSSSCILCTQCWHCLSIVVFILYLVCLMLTVSLECLSSSCILCTQCWHCLSIVCFHPVSCVPNVDSVSPLFVFILYLVYPMLTVSLDYLSSSCILCAQCWHCLSSVYLHPVSCVPNVDIVSRVFIFILYLVCPMLTVSLDCLSSSCILCTQCWQCLWR